jgi:hypothetical protein
MTGEINFLATPKTNKPLSFLYLKQGVSKFFYTKKRDAGNNYQHARFQLSISCFHVPLFQESW